MVFRKRIISSDRGHLLEVDLGKKQASQCLYRLLLILAVMLFLYKLTGQILNHTCERGEMIIFINNATRSPEEESRKFDTEDGGSDCKTIHLASVCAGFNSTRNFYTLLKSILFYRTDKIHLHLLVDENSRFIFERMFESWNVEDLLVSYYNGSEFEREVAWIPSGHYSHKYGLMKLLLPTILAEKTDLSAMVIIDTDMIVLGNVGHLWEEMRQTFEWEEPERGAMFAMVENQSDWYLALNKSLSWSLWPALGRGFNSGLVMVNLAAVRSQRWRRLWREEAQRELFPLLSAPLADQDVFNAIFKLKPHLVKRLPCTLNLQLNDHSRLNESCPSSLRRSRSELQIVHWNSPTKYNSKNPIADYYQNWFTTFLNWNGELLRQSGCSLAAAESLRASRAGSRWPTTKLERACREMRPRQEDQLRSHLYYLEFDYQVLEWDVTYAVHLSLERLPVLEELASHWPGPISAAIYLYEQESELFMNFVEDSNNLLRRRNIGYHLVYRDSNFNTYPINRLRNVALNNTLTPYVVLSDIDLLPSYNLYEYLRRTIREMAQSEPESDDGPLARKALVVAAFESGQYKYEFPVSKEELLRQLNLGIISMFRQELWPQGHAPTDYSQWRRSTRPYSVQWEPDYEPFVVTRRDVVRYDESFIGFGFNKVEHIMELASLDYQFIVLPEVFLIHKFHAPSYDILKHRNSFTYKQCIKLLKGQFLNRLSQRRGKFFKEKIVKTTTT